MRGGLPPPPWTRRPGKPVLLNQLPLTAAAVKHRLVCIPSKLTRLLTHTPAACSLADHTVEQTCSLHGSALGRAPGARLFPLYKQEPGLGCPARSNLPLVGDIARTLAFAPAVRALADHIEASISGGGGFGALAPRAFNSVHVRLEKDARDWAHGMGGQAVRPLPAPRDAGRAGVRRADMRGAPRASRGARCDAGPLPPRSGGKVRAHAWQVCGGVMSSSAGLCCDRCNWRLQHVRKGCPYSSVFRRLLPGPCQVVRTRSA